MSSRGRSRQGLLRSNGKEDDVTNDSDEEGMVFGSLQENTVSSLLSSSSALGAGVDLDDVDVAFQGAMSHRPPPSSPAAEDDPLDTFSVAVSASTDTQVPRVKWDAAGVDAVERSGGYARRRHLHLRFPPYHVPRAPRWGLVLAAVYGMVAAWEAVGVAVAWKGYVAAGTLKRSTTCGGKLWGRLLVAALAVFGLPLVVVVVDAGCGLGQWAVARVRRRRQRPLSGSRMWAVMMRCIAFVLLCGVVQLVWAAVALAVLRSCGQPPQGGAVNVIVALAVYTIVGMVLWCCCLAPTALLSEGTVKLGYPR